MPPVDGIALAQLVPPWGYPGPSVDRGDRRVVGYPPTGEAKDARETLDDWAVRQQAAGLVPITWTVVRCTGPNEPALNVAVTSDALALGDVRRARLLVSRNGAARLARALGALLPTPRIMDAIYGQARVRLRMRAWNGGSGPPAWDTTSPPVRRPSASSPLARNPGAGRDLWLNQNLIQESQRGGSPPGALVANAGKALVVSSKLVRSEAEPGAGRGTRLAIYGWHLESAPPAHPGDTGPWAPMDPTLAAPARAVIQPGNAPHHAAFLDYSQVCYLVHREARLEGQRVDLAAIYADPARNSLVHVWGGAWGAPLPLPFY